MSLATGTDNELNLLWRHDDGRVSIWELTEGVLGESQRIGRAGAAWEIFGHRRLPWRRQDDILWQEQQRWPVTIWGSTTASLLERGHRKRVSSAWRFVAANDFTGDDHADILWRNTNDGRVTLWEMHRRRAG